MDEREFRLEIGAIQLLCTFCYDDVHPSSNFCRLFAVVWFVVSSLTAECCSEFDLNLI